jgi:uncharacterized protein
MIEAVFTALGLVFVIEGLTYALVPNALKRMLSALLQMPTDQMRLAGLGAVAFGVLLVWLAKTVFAA